MASVTVLVLTAILSLSKYASGAEDLHFLPAAADTEALTENAWTAFKLNYAKNYSSADEEQRRKLIFSESLKVIESHNRLYETGRSSYEMGINKFSDMEYSEMTCMMGCRRSNADSTEVEDSFSTLSDNDIPDSKDWREEGLVTPVKDQNPCGSCWAFSAVGSLEGQTKRKTGKLVSLSEQNLVDCAPTGDGCIANTREQAFDYIKKNGGIDAEECYPYEAKTLKCRYNASCRAATVQGYSYIQLENEMALTRGIADIGPISVVVSTPLSFLRYKSGVYSSPMCTSKTLSHGVLAVGYGINEKKQAYYIVKNSWGAKWGESGYIRIARNKNNMCGIASGALYPLV